MNKKRNLLRELNITGHEDSNQSPLDIDTERIKGMVNNRIDSAYSERKINVMKSKKKISLIAIAATLVLGVTVFAASGIITSWGGSSSSIPDYKSLPTEQQCIEDVGFSPVLIDVFENGYTFENGSIVNNDLTDENNNSVEKFKSLGFRYEKDRDTVYFSQEKYNSEMGSFGEIIAVVDDVDIYYHSYMNKCVAPDYEMTEEDKKAEANGELVFSYGVEKEEIVKVQNVTWEEDGIHYGLMQMDGELSPADLAEMAKEIIKAE